MCGEHVVCTRAGVSRGGVRRKSQRALRHRTCAFAFAALQDGCDDLAAVEHANHLVPRRLVPVHLDQLRLRFLQTLRVVAALRDVEVLHSHKGHELHPLLEGQVFELVVAVDRLKVPPVHLAQNVLLKTLGGVVKVDFRRILHVEATSEGYTVQVRGTC